MCRSRDYNELSRETESRPVDRSRWINGIAYLCVLVGAHRKIEQKVQRPDVAKDDRRLTCLDRSRDRVGSSGQWIEVEADRGRVAMNGRVPGFSRNSRSKRHPTDRRWVMRSIFLGYRSSVELRATVGTLQTQDLSRHAYRLPWSSVSQHPRTQRVLTSAVADDAAILF